MEENGIENKKRTRGNGEKKALISRINRIAGQMNGIKRMLDEDRYCTDILIQLSAIEKAVKSLSALILEQHMHTCLVEEIQKGNLEAVDELADLFRKFQ